MERNVSQKIFQWMFPDDSPSERTPFFYYIFIRIYSLRVFNPFRKVLKYLGEYLSFDIPSYFTSSVDSKKRWKAFIIGSMSAFIFTFVAISVMCYYSGTLYGDKKNHYYFVEDLPNIINYVLIVPLYVGMGSYILSVISEGYLHLKSLAINGSNSAILPKGSVSFIIIVTISLSALITIQYINEVLDPNIYPKHFWFVTNLAESGERLFNYLGVYYTIITFSLLVFTIITISCFLGFFILAISIGNKLLEQKSIDEINLDDLKLQLKYFIDVSIATKIIAAIFMLNAFTWHFQFPNDSFNLKLMLLALLILGVFIVTLPRYYIELKLYGLNIKKLKSEGIDLNKASYSDLRPRKIKILSIIIDSTIIAAFTTVFFGF